MENLLFWLVPVASIVALLFARYFYVGMMRGRSKWQKSPPT